VLVLVLLIEIRKRYNYNFMKTHFDHEKLDVYQASLSIRPSDEWDYDYEHDVPVGGRCVDSQGSGIRYQVARLISVSRLLPPENRPPTPSPFYKLM